MAFSSKEWSIPRGNVATWSSQDQHTGWTFHYRSGDIPRSILDPVATKRRGEMFVGKKHMCTHSKSAPHVLCRSWCKQAVCLTRLSYIGSYDSQLFFIFLYLLYFLTKTSSALVHKHALTEANSTYWPYVWILLLRTEKSKHLLNQIRQCCPSNKSMNTTQGLISIKD